MRVIALPLSVLFVCTSAVQANALEQPAHVSALSVNFTQPRSDDDEALFNGGIHATPDAALIKIASAGSPDDSFIDSLPDPEQMSDSNQTIPNNTSASSSTAASSFNSTRTSSTDTDTSQSGGSSESTADSYPRVTLLEQAILNQSFVKEPLPDRLARMEKKAFGSVSTNSDLGERTDALEQYAEKKLHKKIVQDDPILEAEGGTDVVPGSTAGDNQASRTDSDGVCNYPRVTALEKAILGQSFNKEPLEKRLSRMEVNAFGSASRSDDLSQRSDALENYAEKKLHKKIVEEHPDDTGQGGAQRSGKLPRIMSMVANSLLGGMNPTPMGMGLNPYGMPGYGAGAIGPFGGVRVRPRSSYPQDQSQTKSPDKSQPSAEEYYDETLVNAATPPPIEARLITKVGWCEMQVFGRTYPTMHLPERLGQLNDELHFAPGKSKIELMDDIGAMMKSVPVKKQAGHGAMSPVH